MSELLDKIKEVQSQVNNCSTLEAKQLLEQADGDVDLAVALFKEAHAAPPVTPAYGQSTSSNRPQPSHQEEQPRRRRRRLWWIPLVAVGGYLTIMGILFAVLYETLGGFDSLFSTKQSSSKNNGGGYYYYGFTSNKTSSNNDNSNKTSSMPSCTYTKPRTTEIEEVLGSKIKNSGKFYSLGSGDVYMDVNVSDYNNATYTFSSSDGSWYFSMNNVTVHPTTSSSTVTGKLVSRGYVNCSGAIYCSSFTVAGYTVV